MAFSKETLAVLKSMFPHVDGRILRGAVLEHGSNLNDAAMFILTEVMPPEEAVKMEHVLEDIRSHRKSTLSDREVPTVEVSLKETSFNEDDDHRRALEPMAVAGTNGIMSLEESTSGRSEIHGSTSVVGASVEGEYDQPGGHGEQPLQDGEYTGDQIEADQGHASSGSMKADGTLAAVSLGEVETQGHVAESRDGEPSEETSEETLYTTALIGTAAEDSDLGKLAGPESPEQEAGFEAVAAGNVMDGVEIEEEEVVPEKEQEEQMEQEQGQGWCPGSSTGSAGPSNETDIRHLDELVQGTTSTKEELKVSIQEVHRLWAEAREAAQWAAAAQARAQRGGVDTHEEVRHLQASRVSSREQLDIRAGDVYGEKAQLASEARELQGRLSRVRSHKQSAEAALSRMQKQLQERIDKWRAVEADAEEERRSKEAAARLLLDAEKEALERLDAERRALDAEESECICLKEFLKERCDLVDGLEGEVAGLLEDVEALRLQLANVDALTAAGSPQEVNGQAQAGGGMLTAVRRHVLGLMSSPPHVSAPSVPGSGGSNVSSLGGSPRGVSAAEGYPTTAAAAPALMPDGFPLFEHPDDAFFDANEYDGRAYNSQSLRVFRDEGLLGAPGRGGGGGGGEEGWEVLARVRGRSNSSATSGNSTSTSRHSSGNWHNE